MAAAQRQRCGVGDFARRLAAAYPPDVEVTWVRYPERDAGPAWRRAAAATEGSDVVHVHYEYGLFGTVKPFRNRFAAFLRALSAPAVVTLHGPLPALEPRWAAGRRRAADVLRDLAYLPYFRRWERINRRGVAHWITHSRGLSERLVAAVGGDRVTWLAHPVPDVRRTWEPGEARSRVMVTPGFVKPHKGYRELAWALAEDTTWSWVIAGGVQDRQDAEHLKTLRRELAERGLEDRVRITGYLEADEMETTICGAAVAVFPYAEVNASGALAWAIGCGVPVVATDLPEFRWLRARGAGLELLPCDAPERWPEVLDRLQGEPGRLAELARRNRDYAAANSVRSCARAHLEIFARVVGEVRS